MINTRQPKRSRFVWEEGDLSFEPSKHRESPCVARKNSTARIHPIKPDSETQGNAKGKKFPAACRMKGDQWTTKT
jgi:hypothetical protein